MERGDFEELCECLIQVRGTDYILSLFANEISKLSLLAENQLDFLDAIFNKNNQSKQQNFTELAEIIKYYFADHQATPKDTRKLINEAKHAHRKAREVENEVKETKRHERRTKLTRKINTIIRQSPRLLAKRKAEQEWW